MTTNDISKKMSLEELASALDGGFSLDQIMLAIQSGFTVDDLILAGQDKYKPGNDYVCNNGEVTNKPPHSESLKGIEEILYCNDSRQCNQKAVSRESRTKYCIAGYDLGGFNFEEMYEVGK